MAYEKEEANYSQEMKESDKIFNMETNYLQIKNGDTSGEINEPEMGESVPPILIENSFQSLADDNVNEEEIADLATTKRKWNKIPKPTINQSPGFVIDLGTIVQKQDLATTPDNSKQGNQVMKFSNTTKNNADADGFVPVITKKSLRVAGKLLKSPNRK